MHTKGRKIRKLELDKVVLEMDKEVLEQEKVELHQRINAMGREGKHRAPLNVRRLLSFGQVLGLKPW